MCNSSRISGEMSKASTELSETSEESKDIDRIVKGHWQNCQSSCEILEISSQIMCTVCKCIVRLHKQVKREQSSGSEELFCAAGKEETLH